MDAISEPPQEAPQSPGGPEGGRASPLGEEPPTDAEYVASCRRALAIGLRSAGAGHLARLPAADTEETKVDTAAP